MSDELFNPTNNVNPQSLRSGLNSSWSKDINPSTTMQSWGADLEEDDDSDIGSEIADSDIDIDIDSEVDPEEEEEDIEENHLMGASQKLVSKFAMDLEDDTNDVDDDDEDDDDDERYLQKLDDTMKHNIVEEYYPELKALNSDEVDILTRVVRNEVGQIVDPLHRTLPFITKYERTRILGERAKQLNSGANPFVEVAPDVLDGYLIALTEFEQKKIPFIVKRPLPNGGCEYWKLRDLDIL